MDDLQMLKDKDLLSYIESKTNKKAKKQKDFYRLDPCPICSHKGHFDIYTDTNTFCSRSGCCEGGSIIDFYMQYNKADKAEAIKALKEEFRITGADIVSDKKFRNKPITKSYKKPEIKSDELSQQAIEYMLKRKIKKETLEYWKVKERIWRDKPRYVFQYFNEKNELEFVSYRLVGKPQNSDDKGGCEANTKQILWGMWHVDVNKPIVICEGQPDAMAIWQSGYKNVVSVPSGSSNMTWIDNCWEWLQTVKEFILFGDNDGPGLKMINELAVRLGEDRTKVINHNKHKDANEILFYEGPEEICNLINKTIKEAPKGLINLSDSEYVKLADSIDQGIPTGFYTLDYEMEDLQPEGLTILLGRNEEGKSTVISQILCNCVENKIPSFLYSGELSKDNLLRWFYKQAIGFDKNAYVKVPNTKYRDKFDPKDNYIEAIRAWSKDLLIAYDIKLCNARKDPDKLFKMMETAVKRYGSKLLVIDNLMSAMEENSASVNSDQSNFVQKCKDFAVEYKVHVILAVHPNKVKKIGQRLAKDDASGSYNITNKTDNVISIERIFTNTSTGQRIDDEFKEIKNKQGNKVNYTGMLSLLKDRENGRRSEVPLIYDDISKRFLEVLQTGEIKKPFEYSWKKYLKAEQKSIKTKYENDDEVCPF